MHKTMGIFLLLAAAGYVAACIALFAFQRTFIYFPPHSPVLPAPHTSTLAVPGAQVLVSERPLKTDKAGDKAVIYFGGNAEDVSASLPLLDGAFPDRTLYLMHYRGYLGSSGKPSEKALVADALALFDRIRVEHRDIVVIGRSLGSGVAVQLAARRPVSRLVLVTPFDSLGELAVQQFPYFPVRWLLQDRYDSGTHAAQVQAPTLLVAAEQDEIIPARSTQRLFARFPPGIVTMKTIEGVGHNSISDSPAYIPALQWAR